MTLALCRSSLPQASRWDIDPVSFRGHFMRRIIFSILLISFLAVIGCGGGTGVTREQQEMADAYSEEGAKYYESQKFDKAVTAYKHAVEITPGDARIHYSLASAYSRMNMSDEAIAAYRQAIAIDPDDAIFHYDLGATLIREKKYDEALQSFGTAVRINPSFAEAHYGMGWVYAEMGKYPEAVRHYKNAVEADRYNVSAHYALGNLYILLGDLKSAREEYDSLSAIDPARADDLLNQINKKK
ncbi:MAG: tetratricopeptide repeat protein [Nitrospirae bacterium]|nr:tetratricopeptide repeat protein [Nitrospirota bacterium]